MTDTVPRAFVCGHPVGHSRSPLIHGYWLEELGLAGSYVAMDVKPKDFPHFVRHFGEQGFAGGNVTIPHKEAAFEGVDLREKAAEVIGAVNTVWSENGRIIGGNTDGHGFAANLDEFAPGWDGGQSAVVLGAGGACRAVVFALLQRKFRAVQVVNRTLSRALDLAEMFGSGVTAHGWVEQEKLLTTADLLVNTTSLGMGGNRDAYMDLARLPDHAIVTDIVYVPIETPLLKSARGRGLRAVDGLGMLLHQAVPGFERWFGSRPEVTAALRARILADLDTAG